MKVTSVTREEYEGDLVAVLGDWLLVRVTDEGDEPTTYALPVRIVADIEFADDSEVAVFQAAHPFGWVKT